MQSYIKNGYIAIYGGNCWKGCVKENIVPSKRINPAKRWAAHVRAKATLEVL